MPRCRISKANVCPYYGREIPDYIRLGLDPNRIYHMYRTPQLLIAAAASFNNVPLMVDHVPVSADAPAQEQIGGTVSAPVFEYPYLYGDVTAWTREAIDGINSGERKELSCAYRYVASMISGTSPDGVRYDGRMEPPGAANHVALVTEGRAGPDVMVADGVPRMTMKNRFSRTVGAMAEVLRTIANPAQLAAMDSAIKEELAEAEDAFPNLSADEKTAACDAAMKLFGKDSLSDEEKTAAYTQAAKDKAAPPAPPAANDAAVQIAVDAALETERKEKAGWVSPADAAKLATDAAGAASAAVHALYAARAAVEDTAGVVALDSAEGVYRFALDKLKVPHADVPATTLAALYDGVKNVPVQDAAPPVAATAAPINTLFSTGHIRRF